jgi:hypothetical protein
MTIEELLNCDIAELEAMSDDELREHFKPYLAVTQPDPSVSVAKPKRKKSSTMSKKKKQTLEEQMQELAKLNGVDLDLENASDNLPANLR